MTYLSLHIIMCKEGRARGVALSVSDILICAIARDWSIFATDPISSPTPSPSNCTHRGNRLLLLRASSLIGGRFSCHHPLQVRLKLVEVLVPSFSAHGNCYLDVLDRLVELSGVLVAFPEAVVHIGGPRIELDVTLKDCDGFVEFVCPHQPVAETV